MGNMREIALLVLILVASPALTQSNAPVRMPENVGIFAVSYHERSASQEQSISIDPIVIVHYGTDQRNKVVPGLGSTLPTGDWTDANFDKIEKEFYKAGTAVSVFSGGEKLGSATIRGSNIEGRDGGCVNLAATIAYSGAGRPRLAASTVSEISGHAATRRAATAEETATLRRLAVKWFTDYGLAKQLLDHGQTGEVISTVLRPNAGRAIIGRFDVTSKLAIHRLFAIAEQSQGQYSLTLADLEIQHDVEDGVDRAEREYVDQLDINNDGVDEVITSASHYEGWSYAIWEFYANYKGWRKKFSGAGGGC